MIGKNVWYLYFFPYDFAVLCYPGYCFFLSVSAWTYWLYQLWQIIWLSVCWCFSCFGLVFFLPPWDPQLYIQKRYIHIYTEKIYPYLTLNSEAPSLTWRASPKEELSRNKRTWETLRGCCWKKTFCRDEYEHERYLWDGSMAYYASIVVYMLFRTVLLFCATPVKVILVFGYATATPILKATPLKFPSENRNGYYLRRINDPSTGRK